MINELFLYDREKGLFKEILKKSAIIEGRYHVSPNGGKDLDTNNLETYIKDPLNGLSGPDQKYPICVCMTPRSRIVNINGRRLEEFTFNLYFVCNTFYTGTNQIKAHDKDTNTSAHHIWYDWMDMKRSAEGFLFMLDSQLKRKITVGEKIFPLRAYANLGDSAIYNRLTKFNNDRLSGVSLAFNMLLDATVCDSEDYSEVNPEDITMPPADIHPIHKNN